MTKRLKAPAPTILAVPSTAAGSPSVLSCSMIDSKISGADEPSDNKVRLAIVGFQIGVSIV